MFVVAQMFVFTLTLLNKVFATSVNFHDIGTLLQQENLMFHHLNCILHTFVVEKSKLALILVSKL